MPLSIDVYALTDTGLRRSHNEDAYDAVSERGLYIVADGMGGHASGQVASRLAVANMRRYITQLLTRPGHELTFPVRAGASDDERVLSNAIQWANERVFIESMKERKYEGMGTTLVSAMHVGSRLVLGHVGDSRIYRFRDNELLQLTRDDSLLNHYIAQGRIRTQSEIDAFQEKNIIVKALGLKDYVEPSVSTTGLRSGDVYLLCTDGLTDQVDDSAIAQVLRDVGRDFDIACETYIRMSNEAGGKDNCTVMLLHVRGESESSRKLRDTAPNIPVVVTFEDDDEPTEPGDRHLAALLQGFEDEDSVPSTVRRRLEEPPELPTVRRPSALESKPSADSDQPLDPSELPTIRRPALSPASEQRPLSTTESSAQPLPMEGNNY